MTADQLPSNGSETGLNPDDIVISGMSGTFPGALNIDEFEHKLYNKIDMVSKETRFEFIYLDQPERAGIIPQNDKFDCGFFGIHGRQAEYMDACIRIFLEKTTEAVFDAGLHLEDMENTRTGVYVGSCVSESEIFMSRKPKPEKSFFWTGNARCMVANRISYFLKLKGPSIITDTACSSSLYALEHAYSALRNGDIDMAIVGGTNLCAFAGTTIQFARLGVLSHDGICKVFDEKANGYVRAEGICALLLQKRKDAKRIYCELVHAKTNCDGYKEQGITYPSGEVQLQLLREFYQECGVPPNHLSYLEAHGTGTKVGDPEECDSVDQIFTQNRDKPLLIGSVKSCVGHAEAVSGCISVVKCILALEKGAIAPNLHFHTPKSDIKGIIEGRMKVVTDVTNFEDNRSLVGINSFGFGGGNCHVLIKGHKKEKINNGIPNDDLPRIVCLSGRTEESITALFDYINEVGLDAEFIGLLHNVFRKNIANHLYRGYIVISKKQVLETSINDGKYAPWTIPILYVVFGNLQNWYTVLQNLKQVNFVNSKLKRIEETLGSIKFENTILSKKPENRQSYDILGNIVTQICIADLLQELQIPPTGTAGYSYGELVCSYFDGVLTLDETLKCANILNTDLNLKQYQNGVSNREQENKVDAATRQRVINNLVNVLKKPRTWKDKLASAEYFADAILKSVHNKYQDIKPDSAVLEIGSNKINIGDDDNNVIRLTMKDTFEDLLRTLGSLYILGYNPAVQNLYPAVQFPVSRSTPRISSRIKWNHNRTYEFRHPPRAHIYLKSFVIDLRKPDWTYISGHMIDGRILFPAAGYLFLTWDVFAEEYKVQDALAVRFTNVRFIRATSILPSEPITLVVVISDSGHFEITERDSVVVTGQIEEIPDESKEYRSFHEPIANEHMMDSKDFYKELKLRGYNYNGQFQAVEKCDLSGRKATIQWIENYVTFMDNMFQMKIVGHDTRLLYVPTHLSSLTILPLLHRKFIKQYETDGQSVMLPAFCTAEGHIIKCGGITVEGMLASSIPRKKNLATPVLERYEFVPNETVLPLPLSMRLNTQMICENLSLTRIIASLEIYDGPADVEPESALLTPFLLEALGDLPLVQSDAKIFSSTPMEIKEVNVVTNGNLKAEAKALTVVLGKQLLQKEQLLADILYALNDNGYIISREAPTFTTKDLKSSDVVLLTLHRNENETIVMVGKAQKLNPVFVKIHEDPEFSWLPNVQSALKAHNEVVLYNEKEPLNGVIGFINCLRREPDIKSVRSVVILDEDISFDPKEPLFAEQLKKNLALNIYKHGKWGSYRHLPIDAHIEEKFKHVYLNQINMGDLTSLRWMEGPLNLIDPEDVPAGKQFVEICYSALNFKDIMVSSGKISVESVNGYHRTQHSYLGMEFSGYTKTGKRVMGMSPNASIGSKIITNNNFIWDVSDEWTLEEAVTIPVVYSTMIYGLRQRGGMKPGQSILIHSGIGGVGQAAITYCLFYGLTVFTTVGNDQRKEMLKKLFPQIPDNHIGNSHDTSFEQMIKRETNGRGVDLVLNSLAEEKLLASVRCLARGGKMIEIGKYDIQSNNPLNLLLFQNEVSFHGVMLDMVFELMAVELYALKNYVQQGIREGSIKPLHRHIFKFDEIEQSFRFMATGKHMGKVVIEIRPEEKKPDIKMLAAQEFTGLPRYFCEAHKSYVLIGGLGGFGLELADWLVQRGAKKLVLSSRRGFTSGYQRKRVSVWESYGVEIHIFTADLSTMAGCVQLIEESNEVGPVGAIFNLAVLLQDGLFENLTPKMYKASLTPKAYVTKFLDEVTREKCPELRNFVIFSSVSCGRGNAGQTNYGMANSIMERICEARLRDGYPAKAIEWGAVGEVGILGEMQDNNAAEVQIGGTLLQKISNCLHVMDTLLTQSSPIVSSIVVAEKKRGAISTENVVEAVASILGVTDLKTVSLHATLAEIGMDSMTAVEIKQMLEREFDIFLSPKEIRTLTLAKLQEIQNSKEAGQTEEGSAEIEEYDKTENITKALFQLVVEEAESKILSFKMTTKVPPTEKAPTVLVIPGLEGYAKNLDPLCKHLEAHIYALQLNYEDVPKTVLGMAEAKVAMAEQYLVKGKPFNIIAYSYGVAEALELVSILESKGYIGKVFCIDGAPAILKKYITETLGQNPDNLENGVILKILMYYGEKNVGDIAMEILACKTLDEKLDLTFKRYMDNIPLSLTYFKQLVEGITKRTFAMNTYTASYQQIKSELILFKPTIQTYKDVQEDFGLSDICQRTIPVHIVDGNHTTMLENNELIDIINSSLDN